MKINIKTIVTLCFIAALIIPSLTHAQPMFDDDVNDVPVDGGLSLLVAAGVGYGAKKLRDKRKETNI
jgi:hypothetical protein